MKLYFFSAGQIVWPKANIVEGGGEEIVHSPTPFFLIQHKGKNILFDTGNPASLIGQPPADGGVGMLLKEEEYAPNQLKVVLGLSPSDIDIIIMSHLHVDHVGSLKCFPSATVIVRKAEYEAAFSPLSSLKANYTEYTKGLENTNWYFIENKAPFDLCGDGRIVTIATPGHTPGHQSLLLNTDKNGTMLLAADACYSRFNLAAMAPPPGLVCDRAAYVKNLQRFKLYEKAGTTLVTGHDPDDWAKFKHAPECYE
jgi:glyoxylase-like metal-dependent hydrolase (beta-lactamase superfamily II)